MRKFNKILTDKRGFTLIEMIVVLAVVAALAAVLTPMVISYIKDAKLQRAQADVKVIASAIQAFNKDMREWPIWAVGTATKAADDDFNLLSSNAGDDADGATTPEPDWTLTGATVDDLDDQVIKNAPSYATTGKRKWMGPYLENISEDPWGNKYYVNVQFLQPAYLSPGSEKAVFVLSAGPNELIDTEFSTAVNAFTAGGDDVVFRIK